MSEAENLIQPMIDFDNRDKPSTDAKPTSRSSEQPIVAVVMGSDSDLPVLQPGLAILKKFSIAYTARITSAHRTPTWMAEFASSAASNGTYANESLASETMILRLDAILVHHSALLI